MTNKVNEEIWRQSLLDQRVMLSPITDQIKDGFDSKFGPFNSNETASELKFKLAMHKHLHSRINHHLVFLFVFEIGQQGELSLNLMQVDPSSIICHPEAKTQPELYVSKVLNLNRPCCMSKSKLDVACMSACKKLVLRVQEAKKSEHGIASQDTIKNLQQLAGYLLSAVAFCVWGVMKSKRPIVGLLVYPSGIYRLSFSKPEDSTNIPLGLHHKLEYTEDPLMMGWFLETFVRDYEADYLSVKRMESKLDFEHVDPANWTCVKKSCGRKTDREISLRVVSFATCKTLCANYESGEGA